MPELLMWQTAALLCGFILDFFIGDPHCIPHPVCLIGKMIVWFDMGLRRGKSERSDFLRGVLMTIAVALVSTAAPVLLLAAAWKISPWAYLALDSIFCAQASCRSPTRAGKPQRRATARSGRCCGREKSCVHDRGARYRCAGCRRHLPRRG